MTPDERNLIAGLFDRMRNYGAPDKDRDAETLIYQSMRANPDAPYMLVQSVLVQEQALQAANDRVLQLEDEIREMQAAAPQGKPRSGGFLGGYWGGRGEPEPPTASVPQVGARATPSPYEDRSPWSQSQGAPAQPQQAAPPPPSGGFMRSAIATAAGVAGGMLVADSIRNMLGGNAAHAAHDATSTSTATSPHTAGSDAGYSEKTDYVEDTDNDPGSYHDDDNDPGLDGGDIET